MTDRPRRIIVADQAGTNMPGLGEINLTGIPNADARAPLKTRMEIRCDLGHWHGTDEFDTPLWNLDGSETSDVAAS